MEAGIGSGQVQLVQMTLTWRADNAIATLCHTHRIPVVATPPQPPVGSLPRSFAQYEATMQELPGLAGISLAQLLLGGVLAEGTADAVLVDTSAPAHFLH